MNLTPIKIQIFIFLKLIKKNKKKNNKALCHFSPPESNVRIHSSVVKRHILNSITALIRRYETNTSHIALKSNNRGSNY